jgi:hypothetical protein
MAEAVGISGETTRQSCDFVRSDGSRCPAAPVDGEKGLCFWHDADISKEDRNVREFLEEWADSGQSMEGFNLRYASLEGLKLSNKKNRDLRGAELLKANLAGANLNEALLQDAELLGANIEGARLDRTEWGDRCLNEQRAMQAERQGDGEKALGQYKEAEEVYRSLRRAYVARAEASQAGLFFRQEMTLRRKQMPLWSADRAWSKLIDLACRLRREPSTSDRLRSGPQPDLRGRLFLPRYPEPRGANEV